MHSLPLYDLPRKNAEGKEWLFDPIRKKWLVLQPEEYVRQCLIKYLHEDRGFPLSLMGIERGLDYHGLRKRFDVLVHGRDGKALVLCECKEPRLDIDQGAVMQLATYNSKIAAPHLLLTNGKSVLFLSRNDAGKFELRDDGVPAFDQL